MKLCIVHPMDPWGDKVGGAEAFVKGILRHAPEDYQLGLIGVRTGDGSPSGKRGCWNSREWDGRPVDFMPLFLERHENRLTLIPLALRFTLALAWQRPDWKDRVVLFNRIEPALLPTPGALVRAAVVHNDIRSQIDGNGSDVKWRHSPGLYHWLEGRLFERFDHIFTVHRPTLEYYRERYPGFADRFSFIPTWIDPLCFRPSSRSRLELKQRLQSEFPDLHPFDRWIVFCGRLEAQKNPLGLLEVFAAALRRHRDLRLVLVGDGSFRKRMEEMAVPIRDRVVFVGARIRSETAAFYQAADLLLMASHYEGMPLTVLEALACGLPVVSTPVGEIPTLVDPGSTGELSSDNSMIALIRALLRALDRSTPYDSLTCRRAVDRFTPAVVLPPMLSRLRELALRASSRRR